MGWDLRQGLACMETARALDMGGEVAIAELKPGFAADLRQCFHEGPCFAFSPPAAFYIVEAAERVEQGIDVGRNMEAEMFEIVAGVGDDMQTSGGKYVA